MREETLTLPDGRHVGVAEFGAPHGRPVVYCHGFPGSRLDAHMSDEDARAIGARLIALDRPGYGLSDFHRGRRIGDWPRDVVQVADALGLKRFAVLAVSGGGPYGIACAAALPERVSALGVVCGLHAMCTAGDCAGFALYARSSFLLARAAPGVASVFNRALAPLLRANPSWTLKLLAAQLSAPDRAVLADRRVSGVLAASLREAFRQGGAGPAHDHLLYARAWDFDPAAVSVPCYVWHGEQDATVPVRVGRRAASTLKGCTTQFYADEGHFSLPVRRMRAFLGALLAHD